KEAFSSSFSIRALSPAVLFPSRFGRRTGFVHLRQTFVRRCHRRWRCGSPSSGAICGAGAVARNYRRRARTHPIKKAPAVGAGGRATPGPKFGERDGHRPLFALHGGEIWEEERAISLSHIIGPIPLSRSDLLPGICSMTPEICSMRPSRWGVLSSTSGQPDLAP